MASGNPRTAGGREVRKADARCPRPGASRRALQWRNWRKRDPLDEGQSAARQGTRRYEFEWPAIRKEGSICVSLRSVCRRQFLKMAGAAGFGAAVAPDRLFAQYRNLAPVSVANPPADFLDRDCERKCLDISLRDRMFVLMCCPNETHNRLLKAFVKYG